MTTRPGLLFTIKQGDINPTLQMQLFNADGTERNVTSDTIVFNMKKLGGTAKITNGAITKLNATRGIIAYQWGGSDTSELGNFQAEVRLNGNETYPRHGYITVAVEERTV